VDESRKVYTATLQLTSTETVMAYSENNLKLAPYYLNLSPKNIKHVYTEAKVMSFRAQ